MCHPRLDPSAYGPFRNEEDASRAARHLQERWGLAAPTWDDVGFTARVTIIRTMGKPYEDWNDLDEVRYS